MKKSTYAFIVGLLAVLMIAAAAALSVKNLHPLIVELDAIKSDIENELFEMFDEDQLQSTTHQVVKGDTLSAIAVKYGTTVAAIKSANGLTSDLIKIGQKLTIPTSSGSSSSSPSSASSSMSAAGFQHIANALYSGKALSNTQKNNINLIMSTASSFGVTLTSQVAYLLATTAHETANTYEPVREAFWLSEEWRKNNLRYYPYYGRGFVQLTWKENYEKAATMLGYSKDYFVNNPDKLMEAGDAAKILVQGSAKGLFTGRKLSDYLTTSSKDYTNARRIINGTDKAEAIASIAKAFEVALGK